MMSSNALGSEGSHSSRADPRDVQGCSVNCRLVRPRSMVSSVEGDAQWVSMLRVASLRRGHPLVLSSSMLTVWSPSRLTHQLSVDRLILFAVVAR